MLVFTQLSSSWMFHGFSSRFTFVKLLISKFGSGGPLITKLAMNFAPEV